MNTVQLQCFLAVAETLNFARAAEQLNVTQPAVTQQIHSLEEELNVRLFKRTTRTVELTTSGKSFINDAKTILGISRRAKKRFEHQTKQEHQLFSIGCHIFAELHLLSGILQEMHLLYPDFHPLFHVIPFQHLYKLLDEDAADVIFAFEEDRSKKVNGIYKELAKIPLVGICAADHPLARLPLLNAVDLKKEKLLLSDPQNYPDNIIAAQARLMENRSLSDIFFCESSDAAITLARAGYGVAILPDLFAFECSGLSRIPIEGPEPFSYGIYYKQIKGNPVLKSFIQTAVRNMPVFS